MKLKNYFSPLTLGAILFLTNSAIAEDNDPNNIVNPIPYADHHGRCRDDQIVDEREGMGRNDWALKCGYLDREDMPFLTKKRQYIVFSEQNAPISSTADCIYGLHDIGTCPLGCFASNQRILFNSEEIEIESAFQERRKTITTLSDDATLKKFKFTEEDIEYYTSGPQKSGIIKVTLSHGRELLVTDAHPLVNHQGEILRADAVVPGMQLLGITGPVSVVSVQSIPYHDSVWHVRPKSERNGANVFVAEGLLTGSLRFQNDWSNEYDRLRLRSLGLQI